MKNKTFNLPLIEEIRLLTLDEALWDKASRPSKAKKKKISNLYDIMDEIDRLDHEINEIDRELAKKYYFN